MYTRLQLSRQCDTARSARICLGNSSASVQGASILLGYLSQAAQSFLNSNACISITLQQPHHYAIEVCKARGRANIMAIVTRANKHRAWRVQKRSHAQNIMTSEVIQSKCTDVRFQFTQAQEHLLCIAGMSLSMNIAQEKGACEHIRGCQEAKRRNASNLKHGVPAG